LGGEQAASGKRAGLRHLLEGMIPSQCLIFIFVHEEEPQL